MPACIVLGNGLTLRNAPIGRMPTFGVNFVNRCGVWPDYYVCVDSDALTQHTAEIISIAEQAKIAYLSGYYTSHPATGKLYALPNVQLVHRDKAAFRDEECMSGHTGVYVALKMAYYAGFDTVHLYGVDQDETWKHAAPDYPHSGNEASKIKGMHEHFALAARVYKMADRLIINHSAPSVLDTIFERAHYKREPELLAGDETWMTYAKP